MVNWVTRRDVSNAAKANAGFLAMAILLLAGLFAGIWWWISGRPLRGEPAWPQPVRAVLRGGLFVAAFGLAYVGGTVGWVATAVLFVMAGLGWWLMSTDET